MRVRRHRFLDLNSLSPQIIKENREHIKDVLYSFLDEVNPEIIHLHNMHYFSPDHLEFLVEYKNNRKIPLVLTAHNVWEDDLWDEMLTFKDEWDYIIAVSDFIKKELIRFGFAGEKITTVHHGIDTQRFKPGVSPNNPYAKMEFFKGKKVIFHPARMSFAKGSDYAVKAFREVQKAFPDTVLVMAGTSKTVDWGGVQQKEVQQIMKLVEENGLSDSVYVQFFNWQEIHWMYEIADICIYPSSFEEPFGLVMLEAMASGKPIIVTNSGGMPEVVEDGVNGFVIPKKDPKALAEKLILLLSDVPLRRKMGETGRKMAEEKYTIKVMADNTEKAYQWVTKH
ncbi:glycosyl transferase [Carboxydothermus pertinax]|uniref:Glycosyl transferase n=2 Tax=Carboxydothermus pertinax TaxID=870242 RepID=A0A1L8CSS1_9THEO|nr:glycosyl transferase [Carboxydothermus pertinax]